MHVSSKTCFDDITFIKQNTTVWVPPCGNIAQTWLKRSKPMVVPLRSEGGGYILLNLFSELFQRVLQS